jgi:hypothetical protein
MNLGGYRPERSSCTTAFLPAQPITTSDRLARLGKCGRRRNTPTRAFQSDRTQTNKPPALATDGSESTLSPFAVRPRLADGQNVPRDVSPCSVLEYTPIQAPLIIVNSRSRFKSNRVLFSIWGQVSCPATTWRGCRAGKERGGAEINKTPGPWRGGVWLRPRERPSLPWRGGLRHGQDDARRAEAPDLRLDQPVQHHRVHLQPMLGQIAAGHVQRVALLL